MLHHVIQDSMFFETVTDGSYLLRKHGLPLVKLENAPLTRHPTFAYCSRLFKNASIGNLGAVQCLACSTTYEQEGSTWKKQLSQC
jgi:hypothetical protein